MAIGAHTIKPGKRTASRVKRVGRGNSSGRGTYSSRGGKGQKARSGGKKGLLQKAFKQRLQKVPKLRGFNSLNARIEAISLSTLNKIFKDGDVVTPFSLQAQGLVKFPHKGAKILGNGELNKKLAIQGCGCTKTAKEAILKAGGSVA